MKSINPDIETRNNSGDDADDEKRLLLRELFLNASLLAVMKETVEEALELQRCERVLARMEEEAISAPAA